MTWLDALTDDKDLISQKQEETFSSKRPEPGLLENAGRSVGTGLIRGAVQTFGSAAAAVNLLGGAQLESDLAVSSLYFPDADSEEQLQRVRDETQQTSEDIGRHTAQMAETFSADPHTVGMVGQILNEVSAVIPSAVVGTMVAGPVGGAAAGIPVGYTSKRKAMESGIDEATATGKGLIEGATAAIGVVMPAGRIVGPLLDDAAVTIGANVALGAVSRAATGELLSRNGYAAQASQYNAMDVRALLTDVIMGGAFLGMARMGGRTPTTEQVDAALTERNTQHFDVDTAPGAPINPESAAAHQDALRGAIESINRGEPVALPDNIQSAGFLRDIEEAPTITPPRDQVLASAREELLPVIRAEAEQAAAGSLPNVRDIRAELGTVGKTLDELDATFSDRAKAFQSEGMGRKKAEQTARAAINEERAQLVDRQSALTESLDGNRSAEQARAELNAMDRGELPARFEERLNARADEITQGFQRKPLAAGVADANKVVSPRRISERAAREELDVLVREHEATLPREPDAPTPKPDSPPGGKVTNSAAVATKVAKPATDPAKPLTPEAKDVTPKAKSDGAPATRVEPEELQMLRDSVSRNPEAVVNSGFDADGNPMKAKAADVLAEIEAEHQVGVREAQSYMAAITCMLRG